MVVRASRRAGACTLWALTRRALPLPLRTRYTEACRRRATFSEAARCPQVETAGQAAPLRPFPPPSSLCQASLLPDVSCHGRRGTMFHRSQPLRRGGPARHIGCHAPTAAMLWSSTRITGRQAQPVPLKAAVASSTKKAHRPMRPGPAHLQSSSRPELLDHCLHLPHPRPRRQQCQQLLGSVLLASCSRERVFELKRQPDVHVNELTTAAVSVCANKHQITRWTSRQVCLGRSVRRTCISRGAACCWLLPLLMLRRAGAGRGPTGPVLIARECRPGTVSKGRCDRPRLTSLLGCSMEDGWSHTELRKKHAQLPASVSSCHKAGKGLQLMAQEQAPSGHDCQHRHTHKTCPTACPASLICSARLQHHKTQDTGQCLTCCSSSRGCLDNPCSHRTGCTRSNPLRGCLRCWGHVPVLRLGHLGCCRLLGLRLLQVAIRQALADPLLVSGAVAVLPAGQSSCASEISVKALARAAKGTCLHPWASN